MANELPPVTAPGLHMVGDPPCLSDGCLAFAFVNLGVDCKQEGTAYCSALYPKGGGGTPAWQVSMHFGISISQLDCDILHKLILEVHGPDIALTTVDLPCTTCLMVPACARDIYEYITMPHGG